MCDVLDRVENRGKAEGREEGRAEGRVEGRAEGEAESKKKIACNLKAMGMPEELIAKAVNASTAQVRQWVSAAEV